MDATDQLVPHLDKGMRLVFQQETDMVSDHLTIAYNDMSQIHERIVHLARLIDHPCLLGLAQEAFQAFADNRASNIKHEIRNIALVVLHQEHSLVKMWIQRLARNQHRTLGLHEHTTQMSQRSGLDVCWQTLYLTLLGQCCHREVEERFGNGDIDVYWGVAHHQGLVHEPVAIPTRVIIIRLRQGDRLADKTSEGIRLRQGLSVQLVYPLLGTVCRDDDKGNVLIISLSHSRSQIEQGRTTGDTDGNGFTKALAHAQGIEACTPLVGNRIALDVRTLVEVMHNGCIATAWTNHRMTDAMSHEQCRQYVDVFFIAIHYYI